MELPINFMRSVNEQFSSSTSTLKKEPDVFLQKKIVHRRTNFKNMSIDLNMTQNQPEKKRQTK
jgi:hypothetical protein